jgi:hypothetical protein
MKKRKERLTPFMQKRGGAVSASPYLDEFGEEDLMMRRGRDLYLNRARYNQIQKLFLLVTLAFFTISFLL